MNHKHTAEEIQKFVESLYAKSDEMIKELLKHQYKGKKQLEEEVMNLIFTYVVQNDMMNMPRKEQKKEIRKLDKFIDEFYKDDAEKQIGLLYSLLEENTDKVFKFYNYNVDKKEVKKIVKQSYKGRHFSENVWDNETQTAKYMKKQLFDFIQGKINVNQITKKITDLFGNSHYEARRLAETEVARCQSAAFDKFGNEVGIKKVKYRATLCNSCDKCKADDGKSFDFKDKIELPRHPFCQCYYDIVE
ncbi:phage head morphogenesis protein [Clostridium botulinum]|uniref:Phage head morphogenesis protein n=1 Tax=Clostridium botulinum TaxID=1491 RepID=A0A6B4JRJ8_CLOBO|nr:phage minor head protein [Clostridium botulinum]EES47887.1 conserved hypothetical protein [Clostridium botulinum E1 str. 'BoNT E Beluga']MBY6762844.1 phage head morphogenesis protein [Clostridium botulinum]MBY6921628.1 phage head morphogenesis protein [Clostridium botulinum]MCR1132830.1 phage head morphogenesis protein [Clostridium botulinum]NFH70777.1 phage head morphogenesis protein [Clostridium botulinum]